MKKTQNQRVVAIIYGGKSCEHDVSVITACLAKGYFTGRQLSVYLAKDNRAYLVGNNWTPRAHLRNPLKNRAVFLTGEGAIGVFHGGRMKKIHVDVAVNCCHGVNGEDGCVAALCKLCGIPLVGSDIAPSAVAMDKTLSKTVLSQMGFPVLRGVSVKKEHAETFSTGDLRYPLIVKPALLGSSIGVSVAHGEEQLKAALSNAFTYCDKALVEEALTDFTELNCSVLRADGKVLASDVDRPVTANELLTFADKYIQNSAFQKPSDKVSEDLKKEVSRLATEIYEKLGFGGVIRVDFLYDNASGKLYVNEINSIPGSLSYGLWQNAFSRADFGEALTKQAVADYLKAQSFLYAFESSVLDGGGRKK